jgi:hypothetical protein
VAKKKVKAILADGLVGKWAVYEGLGAGLYGLEHAEKKPYQIRTVVWSPLDMPHVPPDSGFYRLHISPAEIDSGEGFFEDGSVYWWLLPDTLIFDTEEEALEWMQQKRSKKSKRG